MQLDNGSRHICRIKRPKRASNFPVGLAVFDIEAILKGQTFEAVTVGCIFQNLRNQHKDFRAVFFSEVGDSFRETPHGQSFRVHSAKLSSTSLPYEVLREAPLFNDRDHKRFNDEKNKLKETCLSRLPEVKPDDENAFAPTYDS